MNLDVASYRRTAQAIRLYRERGSVSVDELMRYASIYRVKKVIQRYLEAIL